MYEVPNFKTFEPLPNQREVLNQLNTFPYDLGTHEVLLSGSVGSAKSILLAHYIIYHCITNKKARVSYRTKSLT
jgi:hypothetical protein